jgi:predicted nucleic acid-binding protein
MIILDTNVLSALMREKPEAEVINWLDKQPRQSIWITSITFLEIAFGIHILVKGKRRSALQLAFTNLVNELLENRVAVFDSASAQETASIMALHKRRGTPVDLRDAMIAGIAVARKAQLATRNIRHFEGLAITIHNPWN